PDDGEREAVAALAPERRVDEVEQAVAPGAEAAWMVREAPPLARLQPHLTRQPERVGEQPAHLVGGDEDGPAALGEADEPAGLGLVRREAVGEEEVGAAGVRGVGEAEEGGIDGGLDGSADPGFEEGVEDLGAERLRRGAL